MVITKDMSRLGRDYIMTGYFMERYFPEHRVRYISLLDGIDTGTSSSANEISPFRAIMNDMYARDISHKILAVKRDKQKRGEFIGWKACYGYRISPARKNHLVVDEPAAAVVKRMFALAAEGMSCHEMAVVFNREGIPSPAVYAKLAPWRKGPYGGLWNAERISEMLRNQAYIGNMVQGRVRKVSYKSKKSVRVPPEDWMVVEGTHEPLVSKEIFDAVQRQLASRRRTRNRGIDFPLKGLIRCHECGYPLTTRTHRLADGTTGIYLACPTYARFSRAHLCTSHSIPERKVAGAVYAELRRICRQYADRDRLADAAAAALSRREASDAQARLTDKLTRQARNLDAKIDKIYADYLNGTLEQADFKRIYDSAKMQRSAVQTQLDTLAQNSRAPPENRAAQIETLVSDFLDAEEPGRELLTALIDHIELTKDRDLLLFYRFPELEPEQAAQSAEPAESEKKSVKTAISHPQKEK